MLNTPTSPSRRSLSEKYNNFFFKEEKPYGLAIVRMILPLVLFWDLFPRWFHARELFSLDGTPAPIWISYGVPDWLPLFSGGVVVALMTALMFLLLTLSIGWCTRLSSIGVTVLFTYITMTDSVSTLTKYSVISSHVLFLLSLSQCGAIWSVDAWQKKRKHLTEHPGQPYHAPHVFVWQQRLIQLLIGIVYFGAALTKIHTVAFFTGDQMYYWSLTQLNHENALGEYIALVSPMILVFAAYVTIVWEVLFLFLVWKHGWGRFCMIALGITFHLLTGFMLGLFFFPMLFCVFYCAFLDEEDIRVLSLRFHYWTKKNQWAQAVQTSFAQWKPAFQLPSINFVPQPVLFTATVCVIILLGVEAEHQLDPYGLRGADGPHQLVEMDAEEVQQLLTPSESIRRKDTVLDLTVGTVTIAQYLANSRTAFEQGESVIVQACFSPPHPDMMVECNLYDSHHRLVRRNNLMVTRESLRMHYYYNLDESIEPGEYYFTLESAGEQLISRKISLAAKNLRSPVAN